MWISQTGVCIEYIKQAEERLTRLVQKYDAGKAKCSLEKDSNLIKQKYMTQKTAAQKIKNRLKSRNEKKQDRRNQRKPMHGQLYQDLERPSVDKEKSLAWLYGSGLKGQMKSLIVAAKNQALNTHYYQRNIMKQPVDSK
jgi:hypothetical protein